jgi:Family of unknown function (DUF5309)
MAVFTAYDAVGLKEDISDIITNISPRKTPFQDGIGNEKITQKLFQWQEDSLRAVAANAQQEGFDAAFITVNPTVMRSNNTQILAEASQVSGSLDATSVYGRAKESAYQLAKSAAQVKRDLENAMVGADNLTAAGADGVARTMSSYSRLLGGTNTSYSSGANVVWMGVGNTLDEAHMLTALQNCFTNGAEPNTISVTPANSLSVAAFAKAAGRFRTIVDANSANGKVVNAVDLYVSPFGEVKVILNRFQKSTWTLVYDNAMWSKATLRPWFRQVLAQTGDSLKQMIVGEFSLKHKNYLASSLVVDNTAAALNAF